MKAVLIGIIAFSLIAKILIHADLDKKHKRFEGLGPPGMLNPYYFIPYWNDVEQRFQKQKNVCNLLYYAALISIALVVLYSVITGTRLHELSR